MINPIGWPAPNEANAIVFVRPSVNVLPSIPAPDGDSIAGASPSKLIKMMKDSDVLEKDTARDTTAKVPVPTRNSVFRPRVSANPPATRRNVPFTRLETSFNRNIDAKTGRSSDARVHRNWPL